MRRGWEEGAEFFLLAVIGFGLGGLIGGAILGAGFALLGDAGLRGGPGPILLRLLGGALRGGGCGGLLGAVLGGAYGGFAGLLIGGVEVGMGVTRAATAALRGRRTREEVREVAPALAPAGRGDEAAALDCGGNP